MTFCNFFIYLTNVNNVFEWYNGAIFIIKLKSNFKNNSSSILKSSNNNIFKSIIDLTGYFEYNVSHNAFSFVAILYLISSSFLKKVIPSWNTSLGILLYSNDTSFDLYILLFFLLYTADVYNVTYSGINP